MRNKKASTRSEMENQSEPEEALWAWVYHTRDMDTQHTGKEKAQKTSKAYGQCWVWLVMGTNLIACPK